MKSKHHALPVGFCTVFVFLTKRESIFGREIDKLFTLLEFLLISLLVMILFKQVSQMRITIGKTDDEVIVRRRGRRIKGTNQILKKSIVSKILTPAFDGNIVKVLHEDERTDQNERIDGGTSCVGIYQESEYEIQESGSAGILMTIRSV